jgi:hypothetical protein
MIFLMRTEPADRKLYQRIKAREYRTKARASRTVVALASSGGGISLLKAGLRPGTRYTAVPQDGGAILLTPTETTGDQR